MSECNLTRQNIAAARQKKNRGVRTALLFALPALIYHACFVTLPSLSTIYTAFFEWNGLSAGKFIGFQNFVEIFTEDIVFFDALMNNFRWLVFFLIFPTVLGLGIAMLVTRQTKGQLVYRAIFFLPYVLSSVVAGAIWSSLFSPYYGVNKIFQMIGLTKLSKTLWLGDIRIVLYVVASVDCWHYWGFMMVLFIAALHQVDQNLYEAVRVEGANKWQEFIYVTIPGIAPTLVFAVMSTMMWSFTTFDYIWTMTKGGPGQATEILSTWIYKNAFINYRGGYANALCVIQLLFVVVVFLVQQKLRRISEEYQ